MYRQIDEILSYLDDLNAAGGIHYSDYSALHDLVSALDARQ